MTAAAGPALQRGAIVSIDPATQAARTIAFQFNPADLRRTVQTQAVGGEPGGHSSMVRFTGAAVETFTLDIEIDALATDATVDGNVEHLYGIYPQLSALETLIYPKTADVAANALLLAQGTLEIAPYVMPLALLVLGPNRSVPVMIQGYSIVEQAFAPDLSPVRATVSLTARTLSFSDLTTTAAGYQQFMAYQKAKETFAQMALANRAGGS
jgi:hypothetical protein